MIRGLLAVWVSAFLCLFAQASLAQDANQRLRVWGRNLLWGAALGVIVLVGSGWFLTQYLGHEAFREVRNEQGQNANVLEHALLDKMRETDNLVVVLSGSRQLTGALTSGRPQMVEEANAALDRYSQSFPQAVCYLMDLKGITIASSNHSQASSFIAKSYAFRPYFQQASQGLPGSYWALGITSRELGYYASYPVRDGGKIIGVAVIKRSLRGMAGLFSKKSLIAVIDPHGIVILANDPNLFLKSLWPLSAETLEGLRSSRQFGEGPFEPILTQQPADGRDCLLEGKTAAGAAAALPPAELVCGHFKPDAAHQHGPFVGDRHHFTLVFDVDWALDHHRHDHRFHRPPPEIGEQIPGAVKFD